MRVRLANILFVTVILAAMLFAPSVAARLPPPPPPCQPSYTTVTFHIWQGVGSIIFDNQVKYDGSTASIDYSCKIFYSIAVNFVSTGYYFRQWASNAGGFFGETSTPTTFSASGVPGGITMVIGDVDSAHPGQNIWGGYLVSNAPGASQMLVSGTFVVPSAYQYLTASNGAVDDVFMWTGMGGWLGNANLWQAGVEIRVNSANSPTIIPFFEEFKGDQTCCPPWDLGRNGFHVSPGDTIRAQVLYTSANGVMFNMTDGTSWASRKWSTLFEFCPWGPYTAGANPAIYCVDNFAPDTSTNEWIVEAGQLAGAPNICGVPAHNVCVLPNYGTVSFPLNSMAATNYPGWAMPFRRWVGYGYTYNGITGYTNPGVIHSDNGGGNYADQYGTSPVG